MDFDMLFLVDNKSKSTKANIIAELAAAGELSISQIHRMTKKEFGKTLSYQAIRQALNELVDAGAVKKNGKLFSLDESWILGLKDSIKLLEDSIKKKKITALSKTTHQITLKDLNDLGHFVLCGLEYKYFDFDKDKNLYVQLDHLWIPFSGKERRENLAKLFKDNNTKCIIKNNSFVDKILAQWFKKQIQLKLGVDLKEPAQYIVHGDCVVQIFMSKELRKKMDRIYSFAGVIRKDIFRELFDMTHSPNEIEIVITRNKKIAEQIKENISRHFKK